MLLPTDVRAWLLSQGFDAARVFIGQAPTTLPAVVISEGRGERAAWGPEGASWERPLLFVDSLATTYAAARTQADAVVAALRGMTQQTINDVVYLFVDPAAPYHLSDEDSYVVVRVEADVWKGLAA
jgi:hypothetical protein